MRELLLPPVDLYEEIYRLVRQIPRGKVSTPRALSEALGDAKAVRAVMETIETAEQSRSLPVHRVVSKEGKPLCVSLTPEVCLELLRREEVEVIDGSVTPLEEYLFRDFETSSPLKRLQELQKRLAEEVALKDDSSKILEVVAGVDVAYRGRHGFGVCVVMDRHLRILDEAEAEMEVCFPYVSTYLTFREAPIILKTLGKVDRPFDALMINGHGVAHPRSCGIATHIGLILGEKPTIGVATRRLYSRGKQGESPYGDQITKIQRAHHGTIYVSPGNNITLERSLETAKAFLGEHRLPEPLWRAHVKARN